MPLILHSDPCPTSPAHFRCRFPNMTLVQETWIEQLLFVSTEMLISRKIKMSVLNNFTFLISDLPYVTSYFGNMSKYMCKWVWDYSSQFRNCPDPFHCKSFPCPCLSICKDCAWVLRKRWVNAYCFMWYDPWSVHTNAWIDTFNPFKPLHWYAYSPYCSLYIS